MTQLVLDPCCGGRMMWFNRQDQRALFGDIRSEKHTLCDGRAFNITPDLNMDFRAMPFPDESFRLVCFDPPPPAPRWPGVLATCQVRNPQ